MNSVSTVKLGDVADFTNGGAWSDKEYVDEGIPIVRVTDFESNTINISSCKYLPTESFAKYHKHETFLKTW